MNISKGIVLADSTSSECKIIKAEALDGMILIVTFSLMFSIVVLVITTKNRIKTVENFKISPYHLDFY